MRRLVVIALITLMVVPLVGLMSPPVEAAKVGIGILVDMSHGQTVGGLVEMMRMVPEGNWVVLLPSGGDPGILPDYVRSNAEVRYGGFTATTLRDVEVVIIGQALSLLSPDELYALVGWFNGGTPRAIWVAGDSDYPAQGNEIAQQVINMVAEAIGAHLRIDYVAVDDTLSNAKATYRVVGIVDPDPEVAELKYGVNVSLFHGPGPLAAVLDDGTWVNPIEVKIPNVYVVARTTEGGKISEYQPSAPGAPGMIHQLYSPGDIGVYPLLAVEILPNGNRFIVSGESPYGGYQSGLTYVYYGVVMQGLRLFRNLVLWSAQYYGELLAYKELLEGKSALLDLTNRAEELSSHLTALASQIDSLSRSLSTVKSTVDSHTTQIGSISNRLSTLEGTVNAQGTQLNSLNNKLSGLESRVSSVEGSVSTLNTKAGSLESRVTGLEGVAGNITTALALGGVALVLSLISIVLVFMKRK